MNAKILLIEDDAGCQLLFRNRLTDLGYQVVVASTGAMGLMEARAAKFGLFLVDVGLGSGIDGYEVCRRLRAAPEFHGVPVVLISGQVKSQDDLHRGYEAGCQSFLVKGDLILLEDVVRAMLRIKSLQDDLALQNRLLEEQNRRRPARNGEGADPGARAGREPISARPDGVLLVDTEGEIRMCDRGARELFGQGVEGKHLASVAPDSRLEAAARDTIAEPHELIRFDVADRLGRGPRPWMACMVPLVPPPDRTAPRLRILLLFDAARRRVDAAADESALRRERGVLVEAALAAYQPQALLGDSGAMRELRERLASLARSEEPVLLEGPPGSGKGLAARVLHFATPRSGSFIVVECRASEPELEVELFGSVRGPSEADSERAGAFHQAENGLVYLQDVERLPLALQERVLDVLQSGRVRRVGASSGERVDVRVVAGSRGDLVQAVEQGRFRRDLYQRLALERVQLPRLQGRTADIELLAEHFLRRFARFAGARLSPEALFVLTQQDWPENVRGLARAIQGACTVAGSAVVGVTDLPDELGERQRVVARSTAGAQQRPRIFRMLEPEEPATSSTLLLDYERRALLHALRETGGDKLAAARLVGVGKSTFYRKLKQHGIR